jgi:hypothetical protein
MRDKLQIRFDDPAFVLTEREMLRRNRALLPTWTYDDAIRFDQALEASDVILLAMYDALNGTYCEINRSVRVRIGSEMLQRWSSTRSGPETDGRKLDIDIKGRIDLVMQSLAAIGQKVRARAQIFVIGYPTLASTNPNKIAKRQAYNEACRNFCESHEQFRFVDVDKLLPREELISERHFSPAGYFALAQHILSLSGLSGPALDMHESGRGRTKQSFSTAKIASVVS